MNRAHKTRIYPNNVKASKLLQHCGISRLTYNVCLAKWNEDYKRGVKHNYYTIKKWWNSIKREEFPFAYDVSKWCQEAAIKDLDGAFKKMFKKQNKHPRFHKKGVHDSFRIDGSVIKIDGKYLHLPKGITLRMAEPLRYEVTKINNVTVSRTADMWFVSISCEIPDIPRESQSGEVGIDLGIKTLAVLSDGTVYENHQALKKFEKKMTRLQRSLSRKKKGSNNRKKAKNKVARCHYKISCLRKDVTHKMTTDIANSYGMVYLEDLNVKGMVKNRKLAKALSNVSFGEIRRQLEYKTNVMVVDRFAPTSKTCSNCGYVQDMPLSKRTYDCPSCGISLDRDLNAALNIKKLGQALSKVTPVERVLDGAKPRNPQRSRNSTAKRTISSFA